MPTQTPARASRRQDRIAVQVPDRACNDPSRHPSDWGTGLGIHRYGDLDLGGGHPSGLEVVHVGPFLRWLDELIGRLGHHEAMLELGWGKIEERRVRRWRLENNHPWVSAGDVEDALDHAGLRLVDVYPETDVDEVLSTWCPTCRESVTVDATLVCPWCESNTVQARQPVVCLCTSP